MARFKKVLIPALAGFLIDLIDFATLGPVGIYTGFIGGIVAYFFGTLQGVPKRQCLYLGIAAGIYCSTPLTEFIPLGTLLGLYLGLRESGEK